MKCVPVCRAAFLISCPQWHSTDFGNQLATYRLRERSSPLSVTQKKRKKRRQFWFMSGASRLSSEWSAVQACRYQVLILACSRLALRRTTRETNKLTGFDALTPGLSAAAFCLSSVSTDLDTDMATYQLMERLPIVLFVPFPSTRSRWPKISKRLPLSPTLQPEYSSFYSFTLSTK